MTVCGGLLWLTLFALQNLGFWEFLRRKTNADFVFLPGITVVIQMSVLFAAGLLNVLPHVTVLLWLFGSLYIVYACWKDRSAAFLRKHYFSAESFLPLLYLVLFSLIFFFFLFGKKLLEYDNFSHWGLIVKVLLQKNRFPNFMEENYLMFQEYPVGSATYIYYCLHILGGVPLEGLLLFSQAYLYLAFLLPIFRNKGKNRILAFALVVFFTNLSLVFFEEGELTSLLIDRLLVLAGMCMLCYVSEYCTAEKFSVSSFLIALCFLIANLQIKNSSVFFVAIACLLIILEARRDKKWEMRLSLVGIAALSYFLWNRHCLLVFTAPELSKHAMNLANYSAEFAEKSAADILLIAKNVIYFVVTCRETRLIVLSTLTVGILVFLSDRNQLVPFCKRALFVFGCLAAYILGMLGMYAFSMPLDESLQLASISRYYKTAVLAVLYWECCVCSAMLGTLTLGRVHRKEMAIGLVILVLLPALQVTFSYRGTFLTYAPHDYLLGRRERVERAVAAVGEEYDRTDYTVISEEVTSYYTLMVEYLCVGAKVDGLWLPYAGPEEFHKIDTKYVVVVDWNDQVKQWAQQSGYVQVEQSLLMRPE